MDVEDYEVPCLYLCFSSISAFLIIYIIIYTYSTIVLFGIPSGTIVRPLFLHLTVVPLHLHFVGHDIATP